ncbi:dGTPase [Spirosomataceae bacterium TFI 002]|nr:dGTPase [Spirosomataceae bacterium TFI 002]
MHWQTLFSNKRLYSRNLQSGDEVRGDYMRDYDRLIFSSQFRRLQNKTQVFPLPGATFVHNRLTHSLEVASVGRSLGRAVGEKIVANNQDSLTQNAKDFYRFELSDVIQTACIAHDIGNPPFGHSGEEAIRTYFANLPLDQKDRITAELSENEFNDLLKFEGNANAFRVLTTLFLNNGLKLTYTTLASIVKYPIDSTNGFDKKTGKISTKKSGFFEQEIPFYETIATELGIINFDQSKNQYARHPFVFLVEAADDICYSIIDLEDAFRLNIVSFEKVKGLLLPFFEDEKTAEYLLKQMEEIQEEKQKLSLLRAMLINLLTQKCTAAYMENEAALLSGELNKPLIELIDSKSQILLEKISDFSVTYIYNHRSVIEKEIAGYNVIGGLLDEFVTAVLNPKSQKSRKMLQLLTGQYANNEDKTLYQNLLSVIDYISGMTDLYAVDLYRKITGIQIPEIR